MINTFDTVLKTERANEAVNGVKENTGWGTARLQRILANRRVGNLLLRNMAASAMDVNETTGTRSVRLPRILAGRRMASLLLYTMAALTLTALCAFAFNALGQDTEFAIAVMGSLIGGFLGALLAAALIMDIHQSK